MVGLSDIPCFGKVVERISDAVVDKLFHGLQYMFCYNNLVNVLNSEIGKLTIQETSMSRKADAEKANGKIIKDHVLKWQNDVMEIQESAKEFSEKYKNRHSWRCIRCMPIPNPVTRFRLGREAVQTAKTVTEFTNSGKELLDSEIAELPSFKNLPITDTEFQNFETRNDAYRKLWDQLETEGSFPILGIYGMPGVGKTRMMEQIWKEAIEKKIIKKVIRADVGNEDLNDKQVIIKLQQKIAGYLDCHFKSEDIVEHRASQLKDSLINSLEDGGKKLAGKILVIFDDVWSEIPLNKIGITSDDGSISKGCKILFTSREENVCKKNKCQHPVEITTLEDVEAWNLFRNTVGTSTIDTLQDESLAKELCKKCAGLPLLICAVAKALQFKLHNSWKDALDQLNNSDFESIPGIDPRVSACVKMSFDRLVEDAKSCLLLCSLFPEDADIEFNTFYPFATGSRLVQREKSGVRAIVDDLKSASLLLNGYDDEHFKLHDLIRDVARSIAVRDYKFLIEKCSSRWLDNIDFSTPKLLHLDLKRDDVLFPENPVCPYLQTMWLQCNNKIQQFSDGFFTMFVNLGFIVLQGVCFSSQQPFSLRPLGKLRTLILDGCNITGIGETDVSFFPENLETLCIWDCRLPTPLDLPNLKNLLKLEILRGVPEVIMVPKAISSLSSLQELHIPNGFSTSQDALDTSAPILDEISKLTRLTSLQIILSNMEPFQDTNTFCNLLEFNICVGEQQRYVYGGSRVSLTRLIELHNYQFEDAESLVERAEDVILVDSNVKVSSICNRNRKAFADLRNLYIERCHTMEHLARISQDKIEHSRQPVTSFSKLIFLQITNCFEIKYLFCNSVAKCLCQLKELYIQKCYSMEAIVMNEGISDGDIINFSNLNTLELDYLPSLTSFYKEKKDMHSGSPSIMDNTDNPFVQFQPLFDGKVGFPSLEILEISKLHSISVIWGDHYQNDNMSFCQMKSLQISHCPELEIVFQLGMRHRLRNLENLHIEDCYSLRNVLLPSTARDLMHLKAMTEIIGAGEEEISDGIVFPELRLLELIKLPSLTSFCCYQSGEANTYKVVFPNLVKFKLSCMEIKLEGLELGRDDSSCQLTELSIDCDNDIQLPCEWQLRLYNLERLELTHTRWHELKSVPFQRLKVLNVYESDCSSTLFTFSAFSCLQQLEELTIYDCPLLEEIVENDVRGDEPSGMDKKTITLFKLRSITLIDLPNLKSFIHSANYECHMPALEWMIVNNCGVSTLFTFSAFSCLQQLEDLRISDCPLLEEIVEDDVRGDETSGMDNKTITLFQLKSVLLNNLPNLKSFSSTTSYAFNMPKLSSMNLSECPHSPVEKFIPFQRLKVLDVHKSDSYTLFTFSAFSCLQQLEELSISFCPLLEEIVENDVRGDELSGMDKKTITLSQLRSVFLRDLPNLKSFSSTTSYAFNMPKLSSIHLSGCPQVEKSIPFQRLKVLKFNRSDSSILFTFSAFSCLQQLEELEIYDCPLLEEIVENDARGDEPSGMDNKTITLSQLKSIILKDLPKLKIFSSTTSYAFNMPKLSSIELSGCPQLESFTYFKTSTALKEFPDLNDYISQNQGINLSVYENKSSNSSLSSQSTDPE